MLDLDAIEAVSFDCHGSLIDWESDIRTSPTMAGWRESRPWPGT